MDIPRIQKRKHGKFLIGGAALTVLVGLTVIISGLGPAIPSVDRAAVWTAVVERGTMLVQVRGPGTLVPEQIRHVSALTAGRVERKLVEPGAEVHAGTVLIELSNPDVQLEALESERQLSAARAALITLRSALERERLVQEGVVVQLRTQRNETARAARIAERLADSGLIARVELENTRDLAAELEARLTLEQERLAVLVRSRDAQVVQQQSEIERLEAIADFHRRRVASMRVQAGADGVLRDLPWEEGQWVTPGALLARVVRPERLKAVLRIPEVQARDVVVGQVTRIDTRRDTILGHVVRIDPAVQNGAVTVDVTLDDALPPGARPDLTIDGLIEIARLDDVLSVGRPPFATANSRITVFRLREGAEAIKVTVDVGAVSVNAIEVRAGLAAGDEIILSDLSQVGDAARIRLR